jgi:hypothetical protein
MVPFTKLKITIFILKYKTMDNTIKKGTPKKQNLVRWKNKSYGIFI